jgi:hypothetical protein
MAASGGEKHAARVPKMIESELFPSLSGRPVREINVPELLAVALGARPISRRAKRRPNVRIVDIRHIWSRNAA